MTNSTKNLLGTIAGLAAMVAIAAIMSDCSKHVADVEASPKKACLEGGGVWSRFDTAPEAIGHCVKVSK